MAFVSAVASSGQISLTVIWCSSVFFSLYWWRMNSILCDSFERVTMMAGGGLDGFGSVFSFSALLQVYSFGLIALGFNAPQNALLLRHL